ncbi:flippase [Chamaesiphon sp. GL140_3_metabinner_50]|uniref:flippase n=1 Tax=Chamaesiphon sp. GL140_3_metabinner_50 TaxID=2970812 RepID=UPI0025FF6CA3|nr:flippase [Chamaesiphon sp. GL140_3_metabinner_50]
MLNKLNSAIEKLSPNIRKILANMGWLVGGRILRVAISLFVIAWMARYLGTDGFGTLNYAIALISIFANVAEMGLTHFVVRDAINEPEHRYEILGTAFILRLFSGIASFLLVIATIFWLRPNDPAIRSIVIIMSGSLLFQNFSAIDAWFSSQVQSKYTVIASNVSFIFMTLVRVGLLETNAPLIAFAFTILAEDILGAINLVIAYQKTGQKIQNWRANWLRAGKLLSVSWPLIFSNLSVMIYLYVDQIMLGQLATTKAVGLYAVAVKISENWGFLVLTITRSVTPHIIEAKKISEQLYYERLQNICNLSAVIFYVVAISLTFFSQPLIVLLFGREYGSAGIVLSIHIWSSIWMFFGNIKQVWIATEELTGFALTASFLGAIINIGLNFWLIPIYQEVGAAIATVISYTFTDYVMCFIYRPARKFGWVMTKALALNMFAHKSSTS